MFRTRILRLSIVFLLVMFFSATEIAAKQATLISNGKAQGKIVIPEKPTEAEKLKRLNKNYDFHMYPGAGHGFFAVDRPSYHQEAATDGWEKVISFFGKHLG